MSDITIITDNKWKPFKYLFEVPFKVVKDNFDYMLDSKGEVEDNYLDGFFKYRNTWYHTSMFTANRSAVKGWHGIHSDSFFSGVLIQMSDDGEAYKVATFLC